MNYVDLLPKKTYNCEPFGLMFMIDGDEQRWWCQYYSHFSKKSDDRYPAQVGLTMEDAAAAMVKVMFQNKNLPNPVITPRPCVVSFAAQMEKKLLDNDFKGGWSDSDVEYLIERLRDEVDELEKAVYSESKTGKEITLEAADVANYSMMIADKLKTKK